ncbi:MAG: sensor histidine kinase [Acidimicrobiales bacterium]
MTEEAAADARSSGPLGLRARVTVGFALGALSLSAVLSFLTYGLVRSYLVDQREESATSQAYLNAKIVRDSLRSPDVDVAWVLNSLDTSARGGSVLRYDNNQWKANSVLVSRSVLPPELRSAVVSEARPARQRFAVNGEPFLAVGVPIPRASADYFEAFSFADVDRALSVLGFSLIAAAFLTTLGGAATGLWASARVLRPLRGVSDAAVAIAGGHLDIRLEETGDKDLAPLARSFNQMVDALSARIQRDARFASDLSHELRSPLTTLSTSLDVVLARRSDLPARARAALDLLAADVRRFQRMVEDLLEISRVDAGVGDLHLETVDPTELVRHAIDLTSSEVPVKVTGKMKGTRVRADKRRMVRVVGNLVENAEYYGGGATAVKVERGRGVVRIAVEDQGPGVPEKEQEQVFERFFRGSESGRRGAGGGSGLGLALVSEHVNLMKGRVWVEPTPGGKGARFVVELPEVKA